MDAKRVPNGRRLRAQAGLAPRDLFPPAPSRPLQSGPGLWLRTGVRSTIPSPPPWRPARGARDWRRYSSLDRFGNRRFAQPAWYGENAARASRTEAGQAPAASHALRIHAQSVPPDRMCSIRNSFPPRPGRVGLRIVSFGAVSVFTHITACQLADGLTPPSVSQASTTSLPPWPLG
jgi:hypothetical protein